MEVALDLNIARDAFLQLERIVLPQPNAVSNLKAVVIVVTAKEPRAVSWTKESDHKNVKIMIMQNID